MASGFSLKSSGRIQYSHTPRPDAIILHLDFDSFFASCEQQMNSKFRGKPTGVTATNGRNCIIAASVEAKKAGVSSPSTVWQAKIICPDLLLAPAHFEEYWEISKKFIEICRDYTPYIEVFSIDEAFLDITLTHHLFGGPYTLIAKIKERIRKEIGEYITVSAGISYNKLLSKLASGMKKPNGVYEITPTTVSEIYEKVPLQKICGIGRRIHFRLNALGIYTLKNLKETSLTLLVHEFGNIEGNFLFNVARGLDNSSLTLFDDPDDTKSVGRQFCLPHNEPNQRIILQNVFELSEEIARKLRRIKKKGRRIGLSLRGDRAEYGNITTWRYINSGKEIFEVCKYLYDTWTWDDMVRQMGISICDLEQDLGTQLAFFKDAGKEQEILETIDTINKRFGNHTIRNGFLLYADKLTTKPNGFVGDV